MPSASRKLIFLSMPFELFRLMTLEIGFGWSFSKIFLTHWIVILGWAVGKASGNPLVARCCVIRCAQGICLIGGFFVGSDGQSAGIPLGGCCVQGTQVHLYARRGSFRPLRMNLSDRARRRLMNFSDCARRQLMTSCALGASGVFCSSSPGPVGHECHLSEVDFSHEPWEGEALVVYMYTPVVRTGVVRLVVVRITVCSLAIDCRAGYSVPLVLESTRVRAFSLITLPLFVIYLCADKKICEKLNFDVNFSFRCWKKWQLAVDPTLKDHNFNAIYGTS